MKRLNVGLFGAMAVTSAGAADAANLTKGIYGVTGTVASATSQCSTAGLSQGSAYSSTLHFPGDGKSGLVLYTVINGVLQICGGFAAVPAGGLNEYGSDATCTASSANGGLPTETIGFQFTFAVTDANSGVGTTTITIPDTAPIGGGCAATVDTVTVRTGK